MTEPTRNAPTPSASEFLGPLRIHLERGQRAYETYCERGRTFFFARLLRQNNESIRKGIIERGHYLPFGIQPHAAALLHHIDVWSAQWDALAERVDPGPDDEFVFASAVPFPRSDVDAMMAYYRDIAPE